jgi:gamma-glutamylcyclotransferase (GGCT)/AIG2-like uncharacterized protein YtfP
MVGKLVFVYGTLRKGDCRFGVPTFVEMVHPEAYLEGFQLIHLGGFPGIIPGPGRVRGEVHRYSSFERLDRIEGFSEANPNSSLFRREEVVVELPLGEELQASVYIFGAGNRMRRPLKVIECGDWFSEEAQAASPL